MDCCRVFFFSEGTSHFACIMNSYASFGVKNKGGDVVGLPHGKVFCVDKTFLSLPSVEHVYGCRSPNAAGAVLQSHLGLTLDNEDGPNAFYIQKTVVENDQSKVHQGFFGNYSPFCYVFYGEEHLKACTFANFSGQSVCESAGEKIGCGELNHREKFDTVKRDKNETVAFLLNNVFCLSEYEKKRAVLYVAVLNPFLISLMNGDLIIAPETVKNEPVVASTYMNETTVNDPKISAKSVNLFQLNCIIPVGVNEDEEVVTEEYTTNAKRKKMQFFHPSVSENIRTTEVVSLLSLSGLEMTSTNESLTAQLMRDVNKNDSQTLYKKTQHLFNKNCQTSQSLKEKSHIVFPSVTSIATIHCQMEMRNVIQRASECMYYGNTVSLLNNQSNDDDWWKSLAAKIISSLVSFVQNGTSCHVKSIPAYVPEKKPSASNQATTIAMSLINDDENVNATLAKQKTANYNRQYFEHRINEELASKVTPAEAWVAFGCGLNPHLAHKFITDCKMYLNANIQNDILEKPFKNVNNYRPDLLPHDPQFQYKMKPVLTANPSVPLMGVQAGPVGNAAVNFKKEKEVKDVNTPPQANEQLYFIRQLKKKLVNECAAINAVSFTNSSKFEPHEEAANDVVKNLQTLMNTCSEDALKNFEVIHEKNTENPFLPDGDISKLFYIIQCSSEPYGMRCYGPNLNLALSHAASYHLKQVVGMSLLNSGYSPVAKISQLSTNIPTLTSLFMQKCLDKNLPWSLKEVNVSQCSNGPWYDFCAGQARDVEVSLFDARNYAHKNYTLKACLYNFLDESVKRTQKSPFASKPVKNTFHSILIKNGLPESLAQSLLTSTFSDHCSIDLVHFKKVLSLFLTPCKYIFSFFSTVFQNFCHKTKLVEFIKTSTSPDNRFTIAFLICLLAEYEPLFQNLSCLKAPCDIVDVIYYAFNMRQLDACNSSVTSNIIRPLNVITCDSMKVTKKTGNRHLAFKRAPSAPNADLFSPGIVMLEEDSFTFVSSKQGDTRFSTAKFNMGYPPATLYTSSVYLTPPKENLFEMMKSYVSLVFLPLAGNLIKDKQKIENNSNACVPLSKVLINSLKTQLDSVNTLEDGLDAIERNLDVSKLLELEENAVTESDTSILDYLMILLQDYSFFSDVDIFQELHVRLNGGKKNKRARLCDDDE